MTIAKLTDMNLIEKTDESMSDESFTLFANTLKSAGLRTSPPAVKHIDDSIDQMLKRWKSSTKKSLSESDWADIREVCRRVFYEREENKATVSRGIWQVLKDNIL